jgi:hypothetical protein
LSDSIVPTAAPVDERPESMRLSMKGLAPPTSLPAEPSPLEMALRSLPTSVSQRFRLDLTAASEQPVRVAEAGTSADAAVSAAAPVVGDSPRTLPAGAERSAPSPAARKQPAAPAAENAGASVSEPVSPERRTASEAVGTTTAVSPVMAVPSPTDVAAEGSSGAAPEATPEPVAAPVTQASVVPPATAPEPEAVAQPEPEPAAADASASAPSGQSALAAATIREGRRRSDPVGELVDEIVAAEAASDAASDAASQAAASDAASQAAPSVSGDKKEPPAAVELGDAVASAIGVKDRGTGAPLSRGAPRTTPPTNERRAAPTRARARRSPDGKTPAVPARGGSKDLGGNLGIAAVMVVAAVVTYAVVTGVRTMLADSPAKPAESASVAPTSPASAALPSSASSVAPVPSGPVMTSLRAEDLELPVGLTVSQDRGLLEVDVDQSISVYVDGVFIGKGPVRQVPLREGAHEIHVQGDSVDMVQPIQVHRGRRARVEMTRAP